MYRRTGAAPAASMKACEGAPGVRARRPRAGLAMMATWLGARANLKDALGDDVHRVTLLALARDQLTRLGVHLHH